MAVTKYFYLDAFFKICPQILLIVYVILLWSKNLNYSCTHGHFYNVLLNSLQNTNTEFSKYYPGEIRF